MNCFNRLDLLFVFKAVCLVHSVACWSLFISSFFPWFLTYLTVTLRKVLFISLCDNHKRCDNCLMLRRERPLSLTKGEDALPAGDVTPPVRKQTAAPLWGQHHGHAVGEHLCDRLDELSRAGGDFLLQTADPRLK